MKTLLLTLCLAVSSVLIAQNNPVSFTVKTSGDTLIFDAQIEPGWHMYAANLPDPTAGPLPTEFVYNDPSPELVGEIIEPEGHVEMDDAFGVEVKYFEQSSYFKQRVKMSSTASISGTVYYMVCNDEMCIPFEYPFSINP